jgi:branched-chain amino acid transport system substrate-binding protein
VVKKFTDDYLKRFAKRPDRYAAQAFDAARLMLRATETAVTRDDIHSTLLGIKDFEGASGKTSFGGRNEAEKLVPILKIQGGKYQQVQ